MTETTSVHFINVRSIIGLKILIKTTDIIDESSFYNTQKELSDFQKI